MVIDLTFSLDDTFFGHHIVVGRGCLEAQKRDICIILGWVGVGGLPKESELDIEKVLSKANGIAYMKAWRLCCGRSWG